SLSEPSNDSLTHQGKPVFLARRGSSETRRTNEAERRTSGRQPAEWTATMFSAGLWPVCGGGNTATPGASFGEPRSSPAPGANPFRSARQLRGFCSTFSEITPTPRLQVRARSDRRAHTGQDRRLQTEVQSEPGAFIPRISIDGPALQPLIEPS